MKSFLRAAAICVGLSTVLATAPAQAAERQSFEKVKDWEIERTVGEAGANPCLMSKTYKDADDNNAINGIVFALDGSNAALVLVYQGWTWDKGEKISAAISLDKKIIKSKMTWIGDAETLTARFPDSIVPDLLAAKSIVLTFDDGDADFDIAGFPQAYESLRRCDIAKVPAAPVAAVPAQTHVQAYLIGVMLQQVVKECEVSTTGSQRTALDAKLAALQPEMGLLDATIRAEVDKRPQPHCPAIADQPKFQLTLKDFIEKTPEEFTVAVAKRGAEEQTAKAAADASTTTPSKP